MTENNTFGKKFAIRTEVTNGTCPMCNEHTVFVSLYEHIYRCITCGADTEQKINGVISFMPLASGSKPNLKFFKEDDGS
tara:strand:- start:202 stop:438 length:237 start_codon:yes stop_codon:yes gene_type:complete